MEPYCFSVDGKKQRLSTTLTLLFSCLNSDPVSLKKRENVVDNQIIVLLLSLLSSLLLSQNSTLNGEVYRYVPL